MEGDWLANILGIGGATGSPAGPLDLSGGQAPDPRFGVRNPDFGPAAPPPPSPPEVSPVQRVRNWLSPSVEPPPLGASLQGPELGQWGRQDIGPMAPQGPELDIAQPQSSGTPASPQMPVSLEAPNLGGAPAPAPRPQVAPPQQNNPTSQLLATLRGLKVPEPPVAQHVATPSLQAHRAVAAPKLMEVLNAMGLGRAPNPATRMPMTLGQALAGR